MQATKCPACGNQTLARRIVSNYKTKLGGLPVHVEHAEISECSSCGETVVNAEEVKRWQKLQQDQLRSTGQIPSSTDVKKIRKHFGFSVSDFAALFGITRQTIHAWERPELGALQLGPASLLLGLLQEEMLGNVQGVLAYLLEKAHARGVEIERKPKQQTVHQVGVQK